MQKPLLAKIALIVVVALLLHVPVEAIRGLIAERKQARDGVIAEIARGSGEAQALLGPVLYLPWTRRTLETISDRDESGRPRSATKERLEQGRVAFLPETLSLEGDVELQEKHRSLYTAHPYTLKATLQGNFTLPPGLGVARGSGTLEWGNALLALGVQDTRGLRGPIELDWGGARPALQPGGVDAAGVPNGVHADLGVLAAAESKAPQTYGFRITLSLAGTERLEILPAGRTSTVSLRSNWPHPSFGGRLLPDAGARVSAEGFAATWRTSHFATNLAQLHQRCVQSRQCDSFQKHTLTVSFLQPVDLYLSVERSVKYGFLFVGLTFAAMFLLEVLGRVSIHPLQYALVGITLAIFFLLLLSLAEHLGFGTAYAIAAVSCVALIGYYVAHVLRSARRGAAFGAALAALYGLLYVLLRAEDHALLAGSILVFTCLAAAMIATRRVDWYAIEPIPNKG